ncbi:SDR family oxidoreductase [Dactylosporangium matsuzakiense]|uniref:Short-chain dehydrogenase n=1 Tax=Dactylosporangium matsuzakiense TaxID=53360 RepID=A0A9W6KZJ4_9ACTN|nr:SDR family oxidoreductase [Dactylosporangium matsuzakiense]GLL08334.1 short-chain dehydrogenase [Dactylosporangium matsuzakiense]
MGALTGTDAVVVGAGRGFGRGVAVALAEAGATVVGVARDAGALTALADQVGIVAEPGDATDPELVAKVLTGHRPTLLVLVAGAEPPGGSFHELGWEAFSTNWHVDVRCAFEWLGAALRLPLAPGSQVVVFSSAAALRGSPASGGYAGSKATQRFLAAYAQEESQRNGLGLTFTTVLPTLSAGTDLGRRGIQTYAARTGQSVAEITAALGDPLTPAIAGAAVVELTGRPTGSAYLLGGAGLRPLD